MFAASSDLEELSDALRALDEAKAEVARLGDENKRLRIELSHAVWHCSGLISTSREFLPSKMPPLVRDAEQWVRDMHTASEVSHGQ